MRIGILSDTHDRAEAMKTAIQLLERAGAEFYIHCGDVGGSAVLYCLAGLPSAFVWGNTDGGRIAGARYAESLGISCYGLMADLTLDGKKIAVLHGDDFSHVQQLLAAQQHDYLLQGHTHVAADERVGRIRHINPGALFRAREKSVALLDTATDQLKFIAVPV